MMPDQLKNYHILPSAAHEDYFMLLYGDTCNVVVLMLC